MFKFIDSKCDCFEHCALWYMVVVQVNKLADEVNKLADEVGMRFINLQSDWSELSTMVQCGLSVIFSTLIGPCCY